MSLRIWLALVLPPLAAAAAYGVIGYATVPPHVIGAEQPSFWSFAGLGLALGIVCELAVLMPSYLILRRWGRSSFVMFAVVTVAAWFALSAVLLTLLGQGWNSASATAVSLLPIVLVAAGTFWLLGLWNHGA